MLWRRSYDTPPPPLEDGTEFSQSDDPRYATIPPRAAPAHRVPQGRRRRACCRTGTTASSRTSWPAARSWSPPTATRLRALVKHLDGISDADIAGLNIPTGIPLVLRARRRLQARSTRAAPTSTRTRPRRRSRRSRTRARRSSPTRHISPLTCGFSAGRGLVAAVPCWLPPAGGRPAGRWSPVSCGRPRPALLRRQTAWLLACRHRYREEYAQASTADRLAAVPPCTAGRSGVRMRRRCAVRRLSPRVRHASEGPRPCGSEPEVCGPSRASFLRSCRLPVLAGIEAAPRAGIWGVATAPRDARGSAGGPGPLRRTRTYVTYAYVQGSA